MGVLVKMMLSALSWLVTMLVAAAGTEVFFGTPRPEFVWMPTFVMWAPILFVIWRPRTRPSARSAGPTEADDVPGGSPSSRLAAFEEPGSEREDPDTVESLLAAYIESNWESHYRFAFTRLLAAHNRDGGLVWSWNWSAAIMPFWFLYRRLYLTFFSLWAVYTAINLFLPGEEGVYLFALAALVQGAVGDRLLLRKALKAVTQTGPLDQPRLARSRPIAAEEDMEPALGESSVAAAGSEDTGDSRDEQLPHATGRGGPASESGRTSERRSPERSP